MARPSPDTSVRAEERRIPAAQARRRNRLVVTLSLAALAGVAVVPALLVRPLMMTVFSPVLVVWLIVTR